MPYFWKRKWWKPRKRRNYYQYQRRNWIRHRRRRPRKAFRSRRRRNWVRKFYINKRKRKRAFLKLNQWQPELIRRSKIKGLFTLFEAPPGRFANNWPQYRDSLVPQYAPGGGGWGIFVFNLGALFDEFQRVRNWWTVSNLQLPLCRYLYCKFRFYKMEDIDYVVYYTTSYPMTDSAQQHADAQPSRMLMRKRKIIVPSKRKKPNGKNYIKKTIKPPRQLVNKWFFQRDFVNTNLCMLTATACSLDYFDISKKQISNNIYLLTLNPIIFKHLNFDTHNTQGWQPKAGYYLYATLSEIAPESAKPLGNLKYKDLIYLGQATRRYPGKSIGQVITTNSSLSSYFENSENFGNIFCDDFIHGTHNGNYTLLVCNVQWSNFSTSTTESAVDSTKFTIMTEPLYETITYNPDKDTGEGNLVYLVPNFQEKLDWEPTGNQLLQFHGYPLWMLLWGWPDWQKKLAEVQQIDDHYILIIKTSFFNPKRNAYLLIDQEFLDNTLEFPPPNTEHEQARPLLKDLLSWHPKFWYQQKSIDKICMSGPGTCKSEYSIQAHCEYMFAFKWGGTSNTMETIADPSKQTGYPVPDQVLQTVQIQNPAVSPELNLYPFDIRRDICTQKAIKRLRDYTETDQSLSIPTVSWTNPRPPETTKDILQTLIETQTKKEKKKSSLEILQQLRNKQHLLQQQLQQLIMESLS
nr:MAG: ORF1 [TTV-like mini virus]